MVELYTYTLKPSKTNIICNVYTVLRGTNMAMINLPVTPFENIEKEIVLHLTPNLKLFGLGNNYRLINFNSNKRFSEQAEQLILKL